MSLDPSDVYPRRNLPPEAENWGRSVESRLVSAEKSFSSANQFLQSNNRSFASQFGSLSEQVKRLGETNIYHSETRTVYNASGLNYTPNWFIPAPSWASSALVQAVSFQVASTSLSGSVAVTALHNSEPLFTPGSSNLAGSLSVYLDNTTVPFIDTSYSAFIPGVSSGLYSSLFYTRDVSGGGSAVLNVGMTVTWL